MDTQVLNLKGATKILPPSLMEEIKNGEGGLSFEPQWPHVNWIEPAIFENRPFTNNNTNNT